MNPRKMIRMWCEKELFNLKLLRDAGVLCPEPVCIKKHILFMRFIGDQGYFEQTNIINEGSETFFLKIKSSNQ